VGWCYEALKDSSDSNELAEAVNPLIEEAYKATLEDYPDCYIADYAAYQLAELNAETGDTAEAVIYYRKFLELARPDDRKIDAVKAKLTELEGQD